MLSSVCGHLNRLKTHITFLPVRNQYWAVKMSNSQVYSTCIFPSSVPMSSGLKVNELDNFFPYFPFSSQANIPPSHSPRPLRYPFNSELISSPTNIICPAQKWQRGRRDQDEGKAERFSVKQRYVKKTRGEERKHKYKSKYTEKEAYNWGGGRGGGGGRRR